MSNNTLCDICGQIIYADRKHCFIHIGIISRYHSSIDDPSKYDLDICKNCDLKLAEAILPYLPRVAYNIEPNAGKKGQ